MIDLLKYRRFLIYKLMNFSRLKEQYHMINSSDSTNPTNLMLTLGFKNNYAKR
jgi:hypothetical protein